MKKHQLELKVKAVEHVHERYVLLRLTHDEALPPMLPGQFVQVRIDGEAQVFLRRPISICFVDHAQNELWLLVAVVGNGTRRLSTLREGDTLNCVLPLGNGFSNDALPSTGRILLVGGGVGVAPLLYQAAMLHQAATQRPEPATPQSPLTILLGARTRHDLLLLPAFEKYGRVLVTTEDGSMGERGFVTQHPVLHEEQFTLIQCCGPTPMMKAVGAYARAYNIKCEVSLENMMACGLGACLCCVEKVKQAEADGTVAVRNLCVCKDGPVFNVEKLTWQD